MGIARGMPYRSGTLSNSSSKGGVRRREQSPHDSSAPNRAVRPSHRQSDNRSAWNIPFPSRSAPRRRALFKKRAQSFPKIGRGSNTSILLRRQVKLVIEISLAKLPQEPFCIGEARRTVLEQLLGQLT